MATRSIKSGTSNTNVANIDPEYQDLSKELEDNRLNILGICQGIDSCHYDPGELGPVGSE